MLPPSTSSLPNSAAGPATPTPESKTMEKKMAPGCAQRQRRPVPTPRRSVTNLRDSSATSEGTPTTPGSDNESQMGIVTPPKPKPRHSLGNIANGRDGHGHEHEDVHDVVVDCKTKPREKSNAEKASVYQNMSLTPEGFVRINLDFGTRTGADIGKSPVINDVDNARPSGRGKHGIGLMGDGDGGPRKILIPATKSKRNSKNLNHGRSGLYNKTQLNLEPMPGFERGGGKCHIL